MAKRRAKGKKKGPPTTQASAKPKERSLNRKRIAGWATSVVLSLLLPTLRDQAYLRESPYILPGLWMLTTLFYMILAITSEPAIKLNKWLAVLCDYVDIRSGWKVKPTILGVRLSVIFIVLEVFTIQWCLSLSANIQHLAPVTVSPSRIPVTSSEWSGIATITVTNHREQPWYDPDLLIQSDKSKVEYSIEPEESSIGSEPLLGTFVFAGGTEQWPIATIGPKGNILYRIKYRLKAPGPESDIRFSVSPGSEHFRTPRVAVHQ